MKRKPPSLRDEIWREGGRKEGGRREGGGRVRRLSMMDEIK